MSPKLNFKKTSSGTEGKPKLEVINRKVIKDSTSTPKSEELSKEVPSNQNLKTLAVKSIDKINEKKNKELEESLKLFDVSGLDDLLVNTNKDNTLGENKDFSDSLESKGVTRGINFKADEDSKIMPNGARRLKPVVPSTSSVISEDFNKRGTVNSASINKEGTEEEPETPPKRKFNINLKDNAKKSSIRENLQIEQGKKTALELEEQRKRQEAYLKKYKPNTLKGKLRLYLPYVGLGVSAIATVFMGVNIFLWYYNGESTTDVMSNIQNAEMVGIVDAHAEGKKKDKKPFIQLSFTDLKKNNPDTVAWLKYDALDVDMPITQTKDNEYYLNHDINRNESALGWVFADTRANMEYLGQNTVLYGHNLSSQQMFGNLKRIFSLDPEKRTKNETIQFTTETQSFLFQIVSVYVTEYTDWTYVQPSFATLDQKKKFIERTQKRNEMAMFKRNDLGVNDQFLTFSTCYGAVGTKDRLVIVGRLVAQEPNKENLKARAKLLDKDTNK